MTNEEYDQMLKDGINERNTLNNSLVKIIAESDQRMRNTNEMVDKLAEVMNNITKEYISQLDSLKECRNSQLDIIRQQHDTIAMLQEELKKEREYTRSIIDKLLMQSHGTSIQVGQ